MKNQYAGDINDYVKYSIIRHLVSGTCDHTATVCWLLTLDDERRDGSLRSYLASPDRFRGFDPEVFDLLARVSAGIRGVETIETAGLLEGAKYFSKLLEDGREARRRYFDELWLAAEAGSLLFFDPDNGLEVDSVLKGRKNSAKYLYFDELSHGLQRGHSIVVYQHFPRVARSPYVAVRLEQIRRLSPDHDVFAICSTRVAYLISAAPRDQPGLSNAARSIEARWKGLIRLVS